MLYVIHTYVLKNGERPLEKIKDNQKPYTLLILETAQSSLHK